MDEASPGKAPPSGRSTPGARIGRYELLVPLREDDGGSAWLASEKTAAGAPRLVAFRLVAPGLAGDARFRELLRQEVKLASGVAHPNVAQVLELGSTADGVVFVASEWVEGETLADLRAATNAKRVAIPPAVVLRVLGDACAGLHAAHLLRDKSGGLLNVVHGDVSAKSILIATNGTARVIDLGFMKAKARHAGRANVTWSGESLSHGQRIDRHSDVWGIGAILAQVLAQLAEGGEGPPSSRGASVARGAVPTVVSDLVVRARSTDPVERFATAAEMQGAIEAALMTVGIGTTRATVAAFVREHVGGVASARAEAVLASLARPPVLSIPTPAVDSVPATVHTVRPELLLLNVPPLVDTGSAIASTPVRPSLSRPRSAPHRGRSALFVTGFAVAILGAGASAYLALRQRHPVVAAAPPATVLPRAATREKVSCPTGMVEVAAAADHAPPLEAFCIDAAPVTTEAYKACSDSGDCKRAGTENRWAGITAKEQAAGDPLCHERDPGAHAKEPINCVTRDMAALYCAAQGSRLPTEAEATFATRGGGTAGFSEWSLRPHEPPPTKSHALGFRCARSL